MESARNGSVIKHTRPSFGPTLNAEATVFVVLTGVLVGLLLVFAVLCICRCCHKSSKSFKRQQVVFTKYSSEKRSSSGKGSRKSRSYEPSVVVDLEAAYSDSSTSPREVEGLSQGTASRNSPPDTSESHKFFSDKDIGRREAADDQHNGQCVVFERTSMALPSTSSSSPKTVVSMTIGCATKRFPRSPPICRQSSVCDDSSEHSTPPRTFHLDRDLDLDQSQSPGRDRRQSSPAAIETAPPPPIVIPQVIVAFHNEVEEQEEEEEEEAEERLPDCGKTRAEVYTYPYAGKCTPSETKRESVSSATVPRRRSQRSMDLEEFEAKVALLRAAAAQLAPEIAKHGGVAALSQSIAGLSPIVGAVMGVECLLRAPSTEVGKMEERMDERCRHNSHAMRQAGSRMSHLSDEDEEPKAKVRYNDTGSLEEVNEQVLDSFVDDIDDLEEMRTEYVRTQYRKLWALRATYEEDVQQGADDAETETEVAPRAEPEVTSAEPSHTTSFESNTEAVEGDHEGESCRTAGYPRGVGSGSGEEPKPSAGVTSPQLSSTSPTGCCPCPSVDKVTAATDKCSTEGNCVSPPAPSLCSAPMLSGKLLLPNPESRRQSYKSMLNRRLRRPTTTTSTAQTGSTGGGGSAENSFDSLETEDGSSTEGSRLEAVTTSVESTTDNTDSAGENQMNRLQQMKADSGYKSLETNGALQQLAAASTSPDKFSDRKVNWPVIRDGTETILLHYDPGGELSGKTILEPMEHEEEEEDVEDVEEEEVEVEQEEEEEEEDCEDEGVGGMMTSVEATTSRDKDQDEKKGTMSRVKVAETVTLQEDVAERSSASRKRRNYVRERRVADSRLESVEEVGSNGHQCTIGRLFRAPRDRHHQSPFCPSMVLSRDYSIDEKSDALFKEFSRLDPALEAVLETGTRSTATRLSRRHHRLYHHPPPPVPATATQHHHKHHHYSYCLHKQQLHEDVPMTLMTVRSKLSPQEGIEEEMMMMGAGTSGLLVAGDASRSGATVAIHDIPIIKVAADEDVL